MGWGGVGGFGRWVLGWGVGWVAGVTRRHGRPWPPIETPPGETAGGQCLPINAITDLRFETFEIVRVTSFDFGPWITQPGRLIVARDLTSMISQTNSTSSIKFQSFYRCLEPIYECQDY